MKTKKNSVRKKLSEAHSKIAELEQQLLDSGKQLYELHSKHDFLQSRLTASHRVLTNILLREGGVIAVRLLDRMAETPHIRVIHHPEHGMATVLINNSETPVPEDSAHGMIL